MNNNDLRDKLPEIKSCTAKKKCFGPKQFEYLPWCPICNSKEKVTM